MVQLQEFITDKDLAKLLGISVDIVITTQTAPRGSLVSLPPLALHRLSIF